MPSMPSSTTLTPPVRRLVLVPAATGRGDALVRRYRLALRRLDGREAAASARDVPRSRGR
jgi:hypothetical protein